jgi:hypothetical protein
LKMPHLSSSSPHLLRSLTKTKPSTSSVLFLSLSQEHETIQLFLAGRSILRRSLSRINLQGASFIFFHNSFQICA